MQCVFSDGRHCDRSLRVRSGKLDLRAGLWRFVLFGLHDAASDPVDRRYPPGWIYGHIGCSGVLRGPGKKLAILKDSHTGAFAVLGLCIYLLWSLAMWSEVRPEMLPVLAAGAVLSRALSGFSVVTFPAAREDGLGKTFQDGSQRKKTRIVMGMYAAASAGWMLVCRPLLGSVALLCAAGAFGYYAWMSKNSSAV